MKTWIPLLLSSLVAPCHTAAQDGRAGVRVAWNPSEPLQGSFVTVIVEATDSTRIPTSVSASLAGQPLHLERDANGIFRAVGAIPVAAAGTIPVSLTIGHRRDTTHLFVRIPVGSAEFDTERLTVAPRFSAAPDSALQARIRRDNAASRRVSENSHSTPRLWYGEWVRPRPGRITSRFGTARVFNGEIQSRHSGVDLDGDEGDPIRAGNRGAVALVGDFYYAGNVVYLDHGLGLVTVYMHMSAVEVKEGDTVEAGQIIGRVGATGRVTGPHLHWSARHGRVSVDALTLFGLDTSHFPRLPDPVLPTTP